MGGSLKYLALFLALILCSCGPGIFPNGNSPSPFGLALLLNGTSDYVNIAQSTMNLPSTFTVEAEVIMTSLPSFNGAIFFHGSGVAFIRLGINTTGQVTVAFQQGGCTVIVGTTNAVLVPNKNYHLAFTHTGAVYNTYINGVLDVGASGAMVTGAGCPVTPMFVGFDNVGGFFKGIIDEVRYSNTVRYSLGGFTPPSSPFTFDSSTIILFHADDGTSSGTVPSFNSLTSYFFSSNPAYLKSPFP